MKTRKIISDEKDITLKDTEKALLNILDDYTREEYHSENSERALLNILEDYGEEKISIENTQRAVLNILDDYRGEKMNMEKTQRAVLNILEDFNVEKHNLASSQRAVLNILEDYSAEKTNMGKTQRAVLNILDDYGTEKVNMEVTQRAVLNILEDYGTEKTNMENTQNAVLNILEDYQHEKNQVETTNEELLLSNKELESFSYSVSHDMRAPIRAINGFATTLKETHFEKFDDEGKELLTIITNESIRMGQLIDDLLAFSRLGRKELKTSLVDMTTLAKDAIHEILTFEKGKYNAKIYVDDLPNALCDSVLMRQVFINLFSNALKYSSANRSPVVEIGAYTEERMITYYVKDNGAGFDMKYYNKLFGVFQRLHDPGEFAGTGIGLAIVKRIIVRHGGKVWAEGKVNEGAVFYFSLPKK